MPKHRAASFPLGSRRRSSRPHVARFAMVAMLLAFLPPSAAHASEAIDPAQSPDETAADTGLTPDVLAIMRKQEALNPAAKIILDAATASTSNGYGNLAFEGEGLVLYWNGDLPADMTDALTKAQKVGPVKVVAAKFSEAQLKAAAYKISNGHLEDTDIAQIAYERDSSGLIVEKMPPDAVTAAKAHGRSLAKAEDKIGAAHVNVAIRVITRTTAITLQDCATTCSRLDDASPYNSGGSIYFTSQFAHLGLNAQCTAGVSVWFQGQPYLLTAAHCATWYAGGGDNMYGADGEYMGRATPTEDWERDILLTNAPGYYWMWDGLVNTTTHKTVHSYQNRIDGEYLCQSGAKSGTVCSLQTQGNLAQYNTCSNGHTGDSDGDCYTIYDLGVAHQTQGLRASQGGDSGAPVFALDGDGVRAKGILSGGDDHQEMVFATMNSITTARSDSSPWPGVVPETHA